MLSSLVSEWTFDELTQDGKTKDTWGNNHGTVHGAEWVDDCVYGKCYSFNGAGDYIEIEHSNDLNMTLNGFTLSLWVNSPLSDWDDGDYPSIIQKGNSSGWASGQYYIATWGDRLHFQTNNGSATGIEMRYPSANTWHHFSMTYDGECIIAGIDGALSNPKESSLGNANSHNLLIGKSKIKSFNGLIDDVRIYNSALSSAQIKQNYIAGLDSMLRNGTLSKDEYNQRLEALASN